MSRDTVYKEMKEMLGVVPSMFKSIPDNVIADEWEVFKKVQVEEHHIPPKYKELMGVAISGITKCRYCSYYHTQFARLFGATEEEIQEAMHYGKQTAAWSAYINGMQLDYDQFCKEIDQVCGHVGKALAGQAG
ncbi:MAG TPA: carboxymuconolactone decarboxylase family protein [Firmicutes bacterium]|mgnify:CR=1 FL=1|nr:carboxymuconolactone decarboxylase family protein [Bacillota bacterium]